MANLPSPSRMAPLFLRLLGVVYAIAFVSLWVQVQGLIGSRGILPIAPHLAEVALRFGPERYAWFPTLLWLGASDAALHALCALGVIAAVLVVAGRLQTPALVLAWAVYLSLTTAGRDFLAFQWDNLLLETGFLAVFLLPPRWRARPEPPSPVGLWLLRWLLFRLMFMSGVVKLASGDVSWRSLKALDFHFETQPLPTVLGWYAHQLPGWVHAVAVLVMFVLELVLPFAIFGPRRWRNVAAAGIVALQAGIALTGNYGFFNLLTAVLAVLLLEGEAKPAKGEEKPKGFARVWPWVAVPVAAVVAVISVVQLAGAFHFRPAWPRPVLVLYQAVAPFRTINGYGLFAVMTKERPEIVVEAAATGRPGWPMIFVSNPANRRGGRVFARRTCRVSTGRCGSPRSVIRAATPGLKTFSHGSPKARRRCWVCSRKILSTMLLRNSCVRGSRIITSLIATRSARREPGGGGRSEACISLRCRRSSSERAEPGVRRATIATLSTRAEEAK
ncbi:MAG: lipase maturation factor family protein [Thermoanaerobaculia bacterium]|nr:lipase maturation factor family protein [Thermoanaerobaculia bacterium]